MTRGRPRVLDASDGLIPPWDDVQVIDERPALPVYLVYFHAPDWLRSACASILTSDISVQLRVIDNSGDVPALDPAVRVIEAGGNLGFTGGANLALRDWMAGEAEFCVVGSHDLHVAPGTLALMRRALENDPELGIVGPVLAHGPEMPEPSAGIAEVPWVSGTCMMLRRRCIEQIGLFDERYGSYAEDFDLCYRATRAGWRVALVGSAVAHGLGTAHGGQGSRRLANSVLFDRKFYGLRGGLITLARTIGGVPRALLAGRLREAGARLAAVPLGIRHLVTYNEDASDGSCSVGSGRGDFRTGIGASEPSRQLEILVIAYGSLEMLRGALEPVRGLPVTVVDNSSLPEIKALSEGLDCRYIDPGRNGGFAAGVNMGLAHRSIPGADVLLLNPDAVIDVEAVHDLHKALLASADLASVGPRQVDEHCQPVRVTWPFPSPWGTWLDALGLSRLRPTSQYVSGAILLLRAEALDAVGGFDERFFLYSEEADWAYRARRAGWRHAVIDSVTAMHAGGGTSSDETRRQAHFHASQERFLRKHYGAVGWQVARAGQILGDAVRSAIRRGPERDRLRARLALYLKGPALVEASLPHVKAGQ